VTSPPVGSSYSKYRTYGNFCYEKVVKQNETNCDLNSKYRTYGNLIDFEVVLKSKIYDEIPYVR